MRSRMPAKLASSYSDEPLRHGAVGCHDLLVRLTRGVVRADVVARLAVRPVALVEQRLGEATPQIDDLDGLVDERIDQDAPVRGDRLVEVAEPREAVADRHRDREEVHVRQVRDDLRRVDEVRRDQAQVGRLGVGLQERAHLRRPVAVELERDLVGEPCGHERAHARGFADDVRRDELGLRDHVGRRGAAAATAAASMRPWG